MAWATWQVDVPYCAKGGSYACCAVETALPKDPTRQSAGLAIYEKILR